MCAQFAPYRTDKAYNMYVYNVHFTKPIQTTIYHVFNSIQFIQKIVITKLLKPVSHIMYYVYTMYRLQNGLNIFIAQCFHHCIAYVYF